MSIKVLSDISLTQSIPLDNRQSYDDLIELKKASDNPLDSGVYSGLLAWVVSENNFYLYNEKNTEDETLGKWQVFYVNTLPEITEEEIASYWV